MATTMTQRPYSFSFSENEAAYSFSVSNPAVVGVAVEIEIYYSYTSVGAGTFLIAVELTPTDDGSVILRVEKYLKSLLLPQLPDPTGPVVQGITSQLLFYYIRYREVDIVNTNPGWITDFAFKRKMILGGVEQMKFKRNNFFATYLPAQKSFLTWQPSKKFVFTTQRHYLTYLHTHSDFADHTLRVRTVFTDATVVDTNIAFAIGGDLLFRFDVSVSALQIAVTGKTIHYYEASVVAQDGTVRAAAYRFYIEYRPVYDYHDFTFFNSLGGTDGIRLMGELTRSIEGDGEDVEQVTGNDTLNTITPRSQFVQLPINKRDIYKGDAGWTKTPQQQEALQDMLVRRQVYELIDGRWIRILNLKRSMELTSNRDTIWSFPLEWSYGFSDNVFTPKGVSLGAGV